MNLRKGFVFLVVILFLVFLIILMQLNSIKENFKVDGKDQFNRLDQKVNYKSEIVVNNLEVPWGIDFLPDGRLIFTERAGRVSIINDGEVKIIGNIEVNQVQESGLLGIAVDLDFEINKFVYLYYTYDSGNRISRFVLNDNLENEMLEEEFILIDSIPNARFHDGGRLKFGPDGKLYATTGDATNPSSSQDINSLAGKILRINKDGSVPKDNPFGNYVYSYGHRNPQGLTWDSNKLFSSEHGQTKNDEINLINKGGNYGWPIEECDRVYDYEEAIKCFSEFTIAPSGIAFHKSSLYIVGLRGNQLRKIRLNEKSEVIGEEIIIDDIGRIRELVEYNGDLYISTSNRDGRGSPKKDDDKIIKISFN